ncbi:amylovoran biosynthesis protein AmsE [Aeromonas caviae]|uniref:glycosyltransferase n=1 Tax=Aeromonas TaxID=642 RepID=UPI0009DCF84B|nr:MULTISPECIES: glycosyltransferase [Aeromonas]TNH77923.1 amylovoran biosynthesis protein AmsE [Aeromonas caviae]
MKFSVLMSVYKNDNPMHFREALNSLCKSTFVPDEVVLVVDGPIGVELDNEIFEFKKNLNIKDVRLSSNCGLGRALSHGIEYCSYDWIARFDSDDICATDRFEKQIKYISNHPDVCLLGSWVSEFDHEPAQTHALRKVPTSHTEICAYAKQRNPFNHMSVMYKKSYVLESGSYQDNYLYEDYALWARMINNGAITANIPEVLVYARTGNGMEIRRGGFKYVCSEVSAQMGFYKSGFISELQLCKNLLVRVPVRLLPGNLRKSVYRSFLRK